MAIKFNPNPFKNSDTEFLYMVALVIIFWMMCDGN